MQVLKITSLCIIMVGTFFAMNLALLNTRHSSMYVRMYVCVFINQVLLFTIVCK